ncbi:MAG: hypothetical protein RIR76_2355 [Verrucomicrobiota bacterium]|jgi:hypothetical protein|nr:DUF6250 domain-containing protein [Opitutaceae bacterium]
MRIISFSLGLVCAATALIAAPTADLAQWSVEQMPGGSVKVEGDALVIRDAGGCTVWWRERLTAPVEITYEAKVVVAGGPFDRLSDLNCFWMALDPKLPGAIPAGRTGRFADYNNLHTYYVGQGGNNNTTVRFRRYDGSDARPLRPEHDLATPRLLLRPNHTYRLRLVARDGVAEYWCDDELIFTHRDPAPLISGWFGLRTVRSRLEIRNFKVRESSLSRR